jgi:2-polyprenyl-3-methyl-5-hydroxy-6-metoxy-1,4-benzoquinol methylase
VLSHNDSPHSISNERSFFDEEASGLNSAELLIPTEKDIDRYCNARHYSRSTAKEVLFSMLSSLEGKKVLDYGCGHGENACILAACGARVTAFDLSPVSIAQARRRAEIHGLTDRIEFHVREAGATGFIPASYDVVTGFAILHHLHLNLPSVFREIRSLLKPGGVAAFIEPVANSPILHKVRHVLPVPCYATPDERQLVYSDFDVMNEYFSNVSITHFYCFGRMTRLLGEWAARPLTVVDHWAQRMVPGMKRFYGRVVVIARADSNASLA